MALTIKDIARLSGYSISTVSRAMNNHRDISTETKQRIQEIMDQYGYVPNNSARNMRLKDSDTIAIMVKGISNPFFQNMYAMFEHNEVLKNYTLTLKQVGENEDEVTKAIEADREKKLCGVIFFGGYFGEESREKLKSLSVPYVLCTAKMHGEADETMYSSVGIDDEFESYRIVKYLIELGHKRIAIIGGRKDDHNIGRFRLLGYYRALREAGIEIDEKLVFPMDDNIPEYMPENGFAVTTKLLESGVDFDALYVIADNIAYGACKAILDSGKRIPEDYSVASFDGLDMSQYYHPSLTTMKQPCQTMVDAVSKQLIGLIEDKENGTSNVPHKQELFPATLVIGQSTAKAE